MVSVASISVFHGEAALTLDRASTKSLRSSMRATVSRRATEQTPPRASLRMSANLNPQYIRPNPNVTTYSDASENGVMTTHHSHSYVSGLGPLRSTGMNSSSTLALSDSVVLKNIEQSVRRFKVNSTGSSQQQQPQVLRVVSENDADELEAEKENENENVVAVVPAEHKSGKKSNVSFLSTFQNAVMDFLDNGCPSEAEEEEIVHTTADISPAAAILMKERSNPGAVEAVPAEENKESPEEPQVPGVLPNGQVITTIGSAKHATDDCRACGFFYKGNCGKGWYCEYCHLCSKADVRRKKKKKQEYILAASLI